MPTDHSAFIPLCTTRCLCITEPITPHSPMHISCPSTSIVNSDLVHWEDPEGLGGEGGGRGDQYGEHMYIQG